MYCFLIYTSLKTQSSIDLFVSLQVDQLVPISFGSTQIIRRCLVGMLDTPYSSHMTRLVQLVSGYLKTGYSYGLFYQQTAILIPAYSRRFLYNVMSRAPLPGSSWFCSSTEGREVYTIYTDHR